MKRRNGGREKRRDRQAGEREEEERGGEGRKRQEREREKEIKRVPVFSVKTLIPFLEPVFMTLFSPKTPPQNNVTLGRGLARASAG